MRSPCWATQWRQGKVQDVALCIPLVTAAVPLGASVEALHCKIAESTDRSYPSSPRGRGARCMGRIVDVFELISRAGVLDQECDRHGGTLRVLSLDYELIVRDS